MPRALTDNGRVELRLRPEDKATLTRAASIKDYEGLRKDYAGLRDTLLNPHSNLPFTRSALIRNPSCGYGDTLLNPHSNLSFTRSALIRNPSWPASPVSSFPACHTM